MTDLRDPAFAIVTTRAELPRAQVLVDSIVAFEPEAAIAIVVADDGRGEVGSVTGAEVVPTRRLALPDARRRALVATFGHGATGALVPFLVGELLARGHRRVVAVADDACLYRPLDPLISAAGAEGPAVIPRRLAPPADGADRADDGPGFFDPGLLAVAPTLACARFLRWWRREVERVAATEPGQAALPSIDQGLLWFGHRRVVDPGLGVARWNRDERHLRLGVQGWEVRGHPLRLVRTDGLAEGAPTGPWTDLAGQHAGWVAARRDHEALLARGSAVERPPLG